MLFIIDCLQYWKITEPIITIIVGMSKNDMYSQLYTLCIDKMLYMYSQLYTGMYSQLYTNITL